VLKNFGESPVILSLLSNLCISYYGLKYWFQGSFETPSGISMEMRREMIKKMMPRVAPRIMERQRVTSPMETQQGIDKKPHERPKP
jgi:hypothetical protein